MDRPLITPQLLREMREADLQAAHQEYADSLAAALPGYVTYDRLLRAMLRGEMHLVIGVRWVEGCELCRLDKLVRPRVQQHLDALLDPAHYSWSLGMSDDQMATLCLKEREPWWADVLRVHVQPSERALVAPLLKELADAGLIAPDNLCIRLDDARNLRVEWTGFHCDVTTHGKFFLYHDGWLVGGPLTGVPGEVAKKIRATVSQLIDTK
jgi:hypothetical protein